MAERVQHSVKNIEVIGENSAFKTRAMDYSQSLNSPVGQVMYLQRTRGNQSVQRLIRSGALQTKLKIGQPGDKYEQEADRVADAVMRMPESQAVPGGKSHIQRACPICEEEELGRQPIEEEEKLQRQPIEEGEELQGKATSGNISEVNPNIESQIQSLKGGGQPLSENERTFFEPRFGHDFSQVRVHTDMNASESAKAVNAKAYTVGQDVVFGQGEYAPFSNKGKRLFAHELTHVVQQEESAIAQHAILNRKPKSKASVQKQEPGKSLSTDELALSIGREYIMNNRMHSIQIRKMINQYAGKISTELHSLSHKSLADNLKKTWNQYLKGRFDDPELYASELRLYFLRNEARYRLISFEEDPALTKHFGEYPRSFGQIIGDRCLDAFYANLEKLYPGNILGKVEETNTTKQILLIKNTLLRLQQRQRGYIPEEIIYAKVQDMMDASRVHEVLEIMSNLKPTMVEGNKTRDKWISTKEFGGGMLTETMTGLADQGMAAPKIDIPYNTKEPEKEKEKSVKGICEQAAKKIWSELQYRCGKYDSNYFFALSLHMDYHSVTLRVERKKGKIKTFWIDQYREKLMANVQELSKKMNGFWPSGYWPKQSTLWQFYPVNEELNTLREVSQKITSFE